LVAIVSQLAHNHEMTTTAIPRIPVWTTCDRMVKARKDAGMSQSDMAERMGISRRSITRYEDGHSEPSTAVLVAWAYFTNVQTNWLLGEDVTQGEGDTESTEATWMPLTPGQAPPTAKPLRRVG
jgi:transcriptional regulator with XRE-family HTH domain